MNNREKAIEKIKKVREYISCPHGVYVETCDFCENTKLLDQALAELGKQPSTTISVFDIDMTLEQVLQNVLANIQEVEGKDRYLGYAETYCQAAYEFVRAKQPKKWVCPDCGVKITGPSYPKLHTCKQPEAGTSDAVKILEKRYGTSVAQIAIEQESRIAELEADNKQLKEAIKNFGEQGELDKKKFIKVLREQGYIVCYENGATVFD